MNKKTELLASLDEERKARKKEWALVALLKDWDETMKLGHLLASGKAKIVKNRKGELYTKLK